MIEEEEDGREKKLNIIRWNQTISNRIQFNDKTIYNDNNIWTKCIVFATMNDRLD